MEEFIGRTIGGYTFRELLGTGGYGAVYRAFEEQTRRDVAIKLLLPRHLNKVRFLQRFETEGRLVARLEHPHIVPLYHYWQDDNGIYLVMRYLSGGSLGDRLRARGPLALSQALRVLGDVASALDAAHDVHVVHRDLKPDNILLDERGNAYLSDFGVAKSSDPDSPVTGADEMLGTFAYLAPEQIRGQAVSPQTDIHALGLMTYELLAGVHPFAGEPIHNMMTRLMSDTIPPLSQVRPDLPAALDGVIAKATAKDPELRYERAGDFAAALKQAAGQGLATPPLTPANPVARAATSEQTTVGVSQRPVLPPQLEPAVVPLPDTPEGRNRRAMLQNVRNFWIKGVLEQSLYSGATVRPGMAVDSGRVDNPLNALIREVGRSDRRLPITTPLLEVFDQFNGKLLVLGDPGSGKTTVLLELARDLLVRAEADTAHPIPVVFNLASWGQSQKPLAEWLVEELRTKYQAPQQVAQNWVDGDSLLLLLDGLDEVPQARREECIEAINTFRHEHGFVDLIVCSRTADYDALTTRLLLNGAVVLQPLNDTAISEYISQLGPEMGTVRTMLAEDADLREMARSPLMLSVLALAYRGVSRDELPRFDTPEARRRHIFSVYVQRMFERRGAGSPYELTAIERYLGWLARQMQQRSQAVFLIEALQSDWLPAGYHAAFGRWLVAVHALIQAIIWGLARWVTAPLVPIGLPAILRGSAFAIGGVTLGAVLARGLFWSWIGPILIGLVFGVAFALDADPSRFPARFLAGAAVYGLVFSAASYLLQQAGQKPDQITSVEMLRFSRRRMRLYVGVIGGTAGILTALMGHLIYNNPDTSAADLAIAMIGGGLAGALLALFLSGQVSDEVGQTTIPNEGIRRSAINGLRMGLFICATISVGLLLATVPVTTLAYGIAQLVMSALPFSFLGFLVYGGYPLVQHIVLRTLLARAGVMPMNLARFLDFAAGLILLRKVGGGYIFVHRYLMEYFANQSEEQTRP